MTIDIKRTKPGRPKKLPDDKELLGQAIREWECPEEQKVELKQDLEAEVKIYHAWFHNEGMDWLIFQIGKLGVVFLVWIIFFYILKRVW